MKAKQEDKLSMYYAVQKVCSANVGVWNVLPAFATTFANFERYVAMLKKALETQGRDITGVSQDKDVLENSMIDKALEVADCIYAYATEIADFSIRSKVDFTRSFLKQSRDSFALQHCQLIHSEAKLLVGSLGDYGVTDVELNDLQAKINAFALILAGPRTAITERKGATENVDKIVKEVDTILKDKLDKLIIKFRVSSLDFYRQYFDARKIVSVGSRRENNGDPPANEKPAA
jgi:hypothetical protein